MGKAVGIRDRASRTVRFRKEWWEKRKKKEGRGESDARRGWGEWGGGDGEEEVMERRRR